MEQSRFSAELFCQFEFNLTDRRGVLGTIFSQELSSCFRHGLLVDVLKSTGCAEKTEDARWWSTRAGQDPRSAATTLARRVRSRINGEFKLGVEKDGKYDVKMDLVEKGNAIRTIILQFRREYKRRRGTVPTCC